MSAADEAGIAIRAARENTKCEVICTFTFQKGAKGYRTMMGLAPAQAAQAAVLAGAQIIGPNCGNGMEQMIEIVKEMRAAAGATPILVHANAGLPKPSTAWMCFPNALKKWARESRRSSRLARASWAAAAARPRRISRRYETRWTHWLSCSS